MPTDRAVHDEGEMSRADALEPAHVAHLLQEAKALDAAYAGVECGQIGRAVDMLSQPAKKR